MVSQWLRSIAVRRALCAQVMAIAGVSFSIWWFMLASDSAKATLEEFAAPIVGAGASAWGWLVDSALALKDRIQGAMRTCIWTCIHSASIPFVWGGVRRVHAEGNGMLHRGLPERAGQ